MSDPLATHLNDHMAGASLAIDLSAISTTVEV